MHENVDMDDYLVWVQHEEEWKQFDIYKAEDGQDAIRQARQELLRLQLMFGEEDVSHVNMDYEVI